MTTETGRTAPAPPSGKVYVAPAKAEVVVQLAAQTEPAKDRLNRLADDIERRTLERALIHIGRTAVEAYQCDPTWWRRFMPIPLADAIVSHLERNVG